MFNLLWQLLAQELPPKDGAGDTQKDRESGSGGGDAQRDRASGSGAKPASLGSPVVPTAAAGGLSIAEEREPSIAEMFFAAPFQTIIWSHSIKDLIDVRSLRPVKMRMATMRMCRS